MESDHLPYASACYDGFTSQATGDRNQENGDPTGDEGVEPDVPEDLRARSELEVVAGREGAGGPFGPAGRGGGIERAGQHERLDAARDRLDETPFVRPARLEGVGANPPPEENVTVRVAPAEIFGQALPLTLRDLTIAILVHSLWPHSTPVGRPMLSGTRFQLILGQKTVTICIKIVKNLSLPSPLIASNAPVLVGIQIPAFTPFSLLALWLRRLLSAGYPAHNEDQRNDRDK